MDAMKWPRDAGTSGAVADTIGSADMHDSTYERRRHGMGALHWRPRDHRWEGKWWEGGKRRSVYASTREECEAKLQEGLDAAGKRLRVSVAPDGSIAPPSHQVPARQRFRILQRDGFRCVYCGARASDGAILHVDHSVSVVDGGTDDDSNLVTACDLCNQGKWAKSVTP